MPQNAPESLRELCPEPRREHARRTISQIAQIAKPCTAQSQGCSGVMGERHDRQ